MCEQLSPVCITGSPSSVGHASNLSFSPLFNGVASFIRPVSLVGPLRSLRRCEPVGELREDELLIELNEDVSVLCYVCNFKFNRQCLIDWSSVGTTVDL